MVSGRGGLSPPAHAGCPARRLPRSPRGHAVRLPADHSEGPSRAGGCGACWAGGGEGRGGALNGHSGSTAPQSLASCQSPVRLVEEEGPVAHRACDPWHAAGHAWQRPAQAVGPPQTVGCGGHPRDLRGDRGCAESDPLASVGGASARTGSADRPVPGLVLVDDPTLGSRPATGGEPVSTAVVGWVVCGGVRLPP